MKKTTKVTLLSAFVFPGAGHLYLKKYPPAIGFIAAFSYLLSIIISVLMEKTEKISVLIMEGKIPLEVDAITQALTEQGANVAQQSNFTSYALLFIWLFATLDAYRIAKQNTETK